MTLSPTAEKEQDQWWADAVQKVDLREQHEGGGLPSSLLLGWFEGEMPAHLGIPGYLFCHSFPQERNFFIT